MDYTYDELLTVAQVAAILKINRTDANTLVNTKIPHLILGSKKVRRSTLNKFMEKLEAEQNGFEMESKNADCCY